MFLALIGNAELLLLALTVVLVCGGAIGWVARDCARLRRWTASEAPRGQFRISRRSTIVLVGSAGGSGPQLARGGNDRYMRSAPTWPQAGAWPSAPGGHTRRRRI